MKKFFSLLLFVGICAVPAPGETVALFDGKTLEGWEGDNKLWRVQDGMITGGSLTETVPRNEFLATKKSFRNFDLRLKIKLTGTAGFINSGVQVRSVRVVGSSEMSGYQVDCGEGWWGKLYDESRRNKVIAELIDVAAVEKAVRRNDWNDYRVRCEGAKLQAWINGVQTIDYTESDPKIAQEGLIGIQVHGGGKTMVQVKDVTIEELPAGSARTDPLRAKARPDAGINASADGPRSAQNERTGFTLPTGFVAELVADESVMKKAVAFNFDTAGRMWVTTASEYPLDANEQPEKAAALYKEGGHDNILIFDTPWAAGIQNPRVWAGEERNSGNSGFQDSGNSGIAKELQPKGNPNPEIPKSRSPEIRLAMPMGILPYKDGAIVQHGTALLFLRDTDGDGRADKKEVLLTGFGIQDSHLMPHGFTRGPGDWIYFAQGAFNTSQVQTREGPVIEAKHCKLMRMKPDGSKFEIVCWGLNNIWGFVIDPRGEMWVQEANDLGYPVAPFQIGMCFPGIGNDKAKPYAPFMPPPAKLNDCTMGGTGLSGLAMSEDAQTWPAPWTGAFMVANPITSKIQAIRVHRGNAEVSGTKSHVSGSGSDPDVRLEKLPDFLVSADPQFRPVAIQFGPEGALYVIDWYNKIISHNEVPRTHPERDKVRTRIWRIHSEKVGQASSLSSATITPRVPNLCKLTPEELVAHLGSTNQWEANAARFELIDRKVEKIEPELRKRLNAAFSKAGKATDPKLPEQLQSLWVLEGIGVKDPDDFLDTALFAADLAHVHSAVRAELARALPFFARMLSKERPDWNPEQNPRVLAELVRSFGQDGISLWQLLLNVPAPGGLGSERTDGLGSNDANFFRYLIRSRLEADQLALRQVFDSIQTDSAEGRLLRGEPMLLAALALPAEEGARRIAEIAPTIPRPLVKDELAVLVGQLAQPPVRNVFIGILHDPVQQRGALDALSSLDTSALGSARDPRASLGDQPRPSAGESPAPARESRALPDLIANATRDLLKREPSDGNRLLAAHLARNFHLRALEPELAATLAKETDPKQQIELVKALRELGSERLELFRQLAGSKNEELRREAVTTLANAKHEGVVPMLIQILPQLPAAVQRVALDRAASWKPHALALANATKEGRISADDLDGPTLDKLTAALGSNDAELVTFLREMKGAMRPVLRLGGKPGDIAETKIDLIGAFTIETWVRLDPGIDNNDNLLGRKGGADINFYDAKLRVYGGPAVHDVVIAKTPMRPEVWTHVAVTRDSNGNLRLYLNGEMDAESRAPFHEPLTGLNIGETNPGNGCAASYMECRIWDVARTAEEIRDSWQMSFALSPEARASLANEGRTSKDDGVGNTTADDVEVARRELLQEPHLVRLMSGETSWGKLRGGARIERTSDSPELLTVLEARALNVKFAHVRQLVTLVGDVQAGRNLFGGVCLVCHTVRGEGGKIGPDLSGAGAMTTEALLRNILTPNAQIESGYYRHDIELKNGEFLSGFLVTQNEREFVLRPIGADDRTIPRTAVKKLTVTKKSLMPEGLLDGMQTEQVRDLFAYLRTLK